VAIFNSGEIERGAFLRQVKRSGVDKLKQTVALGAVQEDFARGREWPETWMPHCRAPILGHEGNVNACCVFAREGRVLSCGKDGTLRMADLATGMRVGRPLVGHDGEVNDCCVFPDNKRALSCGKCSLLAHFLLAFCSLFAHFLFTSCSLFVHFLLTQVLTVR